MSVDEALDNSQYQEEIIDTAAPEAAEFVSGAPNDVDEGDGEGAPKGEKKVVHKSPYDEKREAMFSKIREGRDAERGKEFVSNLDPMNIYGKQVVEGTLGLNQEPPAEQPVDDGGEPAPASQGAPQGREDDPLVDIVVDGERRRVPLSEVTRKAQMNWAAEKRLEEAKREREEARMLRDQAYRQPQQDQIEQPPRQDAPARQPANPPVDKKDLEQVVEKLQLGSVEEGVEALANLVTRIAQPKADDGPPVEYRMAAYEDQREAERALAQIARETPDLERDAYYRGMVQQRVEHEMRADLARAAGISIEEVMQQVPTSQQLSNVHKALRLDGRTRHIARDPGTLIREGIAATNQWLQQRGAARPAGSQPQGVNTQVRQERKQSLQPQPTLRTQPVMSPKQPDQSRSSVIAGMRKARGQV